MTALVRLYPRAWRDRYEAEFLGILAARPPSGRDRLDIVRGAFDARLHPEVPGSPEAPRRSVQLARLVGLAAIVAGLAWLSWLALVLGDLRFLTTGESTNKDSMAVFAVIALLSFAAAHVGLAVLGGMGSMRRAIGVILAVIAAAFFLLALGQWWAPVPALMASFGFAIATAGTTLPGWLAAALAVTTAMALGVFLGGMGDVFGSLSALVWGLPFGLCWLLVGGVLVARGIPARSVLAGTTG